jgi:hypothetical protein
MIVEFWRTQRETGEKDGHDVDDYNQISEFRGTP